MPIQNTRQNWQPGQTVKIGFLSLTVIRCTPTPGDYLPDYYTLKNPKTNALYKFTPHHGLEKIEATKEKT